MKNLLSSMVLIFLISCESAPKSNGFALRFTMGTQA